MTKLVDPFFLFLLFVVFPLVSWLSWRRVLRTIADGGIVDRRSLYRANMAGQWSALAVLLLFWWLLGRPLEWLGIHGNLGIPFLAGMIIGLAALALLARSATAIRRLDHDDRAQYRERLGEITHFLPQSDRERSWFFGLSVTAGVVEELLFRGYALWALAQWMPLPAAIVVSSLGFGLSHGYQGFGGVLRTAAIGGVFALLYVGTGSIWLPILFHALFDVIQGLQLRELFREPSEPTTPAPKPA